MEHAHEIGFINGAFRPNFCINKLRCGIIRKQSANELQGYEVNGHRYIENGRRAKGLAGIRSAIVRL
ncbi:hypothetical protein MU1_54770 [Paenibacillus glycanilyticus]|uniref:Uncharacterized protein n=1 Tax=Paenibacillus glycanilyticus TaxID=126569 RepID=A0ABQ6GJW0_9BACL|nr:hypothetical protein MU1_54770 [Paenibacillus glycanilyticus]